MFSYLSIFKSQTSLMLTTAIMTGAVAYAVTKGAIDHRSELASQRRDFTSESTLGTAVAGAIANPEYARALVDEDRKHLAILDQMPITVLPVLNPDIEERIPAPLKPALNQPLVSSEDLQISKRNAQLKELVRAGAVEMEMADAPEAGLMREAEAARASGGGLAKQRRLDEESASEILPLRPRAEQIREVMSKIRFSVQQCYDVQMIPGRVDVRLTIEGSSGRVVDSLVQASPNTVACIERLFGSLQFPRFRLERFIVKYPYMFR